MLYLDESQIDAVNRMHNGCILCGNVGSGKSRTALAYYIFKECKGRVPINGKGSLGEMKFPRDLFIITTAKKRDSKEWIVECSAVYICDDPKLNISNVRVTVDSWNNIKKYDKIQNAFFIFDEQRVTGSGVWVKTFLRIARANHWILLSATPGDTWSDYIPVFIANGFYRNKTDFNSQHCIFSRFAKYPKIEKYVNTGKLIRNRNDILVNMEIVKLTSRHKIYVPVEYDKEMYKRVWKDRWDPYDNEPIQETGKLLYLLRKVVNDDQSRCNALGKVILEDNHPRAVIFYNYTYEVEAIRTALDVMGVQHTEWNGSKHEQIPDGDRWAYLVQYSAGCEGWNCTRTDTIIFYSLNYSYRMTEQAEGRIDRRNTPYKDLYYYIFKSASPIDIAIWRALCKKKNFNERSFLGL